MSDRELLLPEGSVLVHIGPFKTGSTAIQMALAGQRDKLGDFGVLYPGTRHRQTWPVWGLLGRTPPGLKPPNVKSWEHLVKLVENPEAGRTCISSEDLGTAGAKDARRLVSDIGPDRVHVLAVVRRLDRLLPSQWQERIKTCSETEDYGEWLHHVLAEERSSGAARTFWWSHDIAATIRRWAPPLPPEQLTLIVSDDSDRRLIPNTFEAMLGLPSGFLTPEPGENSSLTMEKVELNRQINEMLATHDWPDIIYRRLIRMGMLQGLKTAPALPGDPVIPQLPAWAADRITELSNARADVLSAAAANGVRIIGDPDDLRVELDPADDSLPPRPTSIAIDAAAAAIEGVVAGAIRHQEIVLEELETKYLKETQRAARAAKRTTDRDRQPSVDDTSAAELLRIVARRGAARAGLRRRG